MVIMNLSIRTSVFVKELNSNVLNIFYERV